YATALEALIRACRFDWDLEVKLALLHASLVPASAGAEEPPPEAEGAPSTEVQVPDNALIDILSAVQPSNETGEGRKKRLEEAEQLATNARRLAGPSFFWDNDEKRKAAIALRQPGAYGTSTGDYTEGYLKELAKLRDLVLPEG